LLGVLYNNLRNNVSVETENNITNKPIIIPLKGKGMELNEQSIFILKSHVIALILYNKIIIIMLKIKTNILL